MLLFVRCIDSINVHGINISVGDYAGQELFFLDGVYHITLRSPVLLGFPESLFLGDALLQLVLDDPLLALGKESDPSFQLLHATWRVEKILHDFVSRDCTFEIVFFESRPSFRTEVQC